MEPRYSCSLSTELLSESEMLQYTYRRLAMKMFLEKKKPIPKKLIKDLQELKRNRANVLEARGIRRELHDKYDNCYDDYLKRLASEKGRKSVMDNVQELYEEYRQEHKYLNDTPMEPECEGCLFGQIRKAFPEFIRQKKDGKCFFYNTAEGKLTWLTDTAMFQSMRKDIKTSKNPEGNLILLDEKNNKEKELNGKKWYCFVMKDYVDPQPVHSNPLWF